MLLARAQGPVCRYNLYLSSHMLFALRSQASSLLLPPQV